MKKFKNLLEQHREVGRFKPVVPHNVKSKGVGPRQAVDSAKVKLREENDTEEKVEMVQSQLHFIYYACKEILDYIDMGGEVEEWYQVKIAKAFSEFESLHAYMEGEKRRNGMVKEEVETLEEGKMKEIATDIGHHLDKHITNYKKVGGAEHLGQKTVDTAHKIAKMHNIEHKHAQKYVNDYVDSRLSEETEEITEMNKTGVTPGWMLKVKSKNKGLESLADKVKKAKAGSMSGIMKKYGGKTGEEIAKMKKEEVEQLDEIGDTMKGQRNLERYVHKAQVDTVMARQGTPGHKDRVKGVIGAAKRLTKSYQTVKSEETEIVEGENKQVKDGDPCWAGYEMVGFKMKNGKKVPNCVPVNEAVDAPFEGGKSAKGTVTDKSGAKHSPMSRVRDIARKAAEKQSKKAEAPKQSSKAKIVKDAAKKSKDNANKDKFQANPTLSSEVMKQ